MIFLAAAIICNLVMTFVMKHSESHSGNRYGITVFNYLTGTIMGYFMMEDKTLIINHFDGVFTLGFSVVNAAFFVSALLAIQACINKNGAPLTSTFNRMGILIPTVASAFLFGEIPTLLQGAGIGLAIFAIIYMNGGNAAEGRTQKGRKNTTLLLAAFITGGCVDLMSKLFDEWGQDVYKERFVFYTFACSLMIAVIVCLRKNRKVTSKDVLMGVMVGIPNQLTTLCLLKAVGQLPAFLVYPCYSAGVILAVNAVNLLIFREVLTRREYVATAIIALGLICINI